MFNPSKDEADFKDKLEKAYKSLRVMGRGLVTVDVKEVQQSPEFKEILMKAKKLFEVEQ